MLLLKRLIPVMVIALAIAVFFTFDLGHYLSFESLASHHHDLVQHVESNVVLAALTYMGIYILVVVFSLPGGLIMTLTGGFLFGAALGATLAVLGATIGATMLFLVAKTSLGDFLLAKAGNTVKKLQAGFEANVWSYMFFLRLVPIFPFFLVNLAPAFLGVPLRVYVVATLLGMIPAAFIYALAGSGLGRVFEQGGTFSVGSILTPEMMGAFIGLGLLALVPAIYKRFANREKKLGDGA